MRKVTLLRPFPPSHTLRALAKERHIDAVRRLHENDIDGFFSRLRDVERIEREAKAAARWEDACELSRTVTDSILERSK